MKFVRTFFTLFFVLSISITASGTDESCSGIKIFQENFDRRIENISFTSPQQSWFILADGGFNGRGGAFSVRGNNATAVHSASFPISLTTNRESLFILKGWIKTQNVNYRRDPIVEIEFLGTNYGRILFREFNSHSDYSYFEEKFVLPSGLTSGSLQIKFYGTSGQACIDELVIEDITDCPEPTSNPYEIVLSGGSSSPWLTSTRYRIIGELDDFYSNDPVWCDLDFSRLLLAAGERNPVDPASVKVFGVLPDGSQEEQVVSFGDPISKLSDRYIRNGTLKWKAKEQVKQYEIYFSPSGSVGTFPQASNSFLGVGELLTYESSELNYAWGGWPGLNLEVLDVDGDGDLDIYGNSTDGGFWLHRNIGSNSNPLFLPRSRPLSTDKTPSTFFSNEIYADWDGDGQDDMIYTVRPVRTNRFANISATIYVRFKRNGVFASPVPVSTSPGTPLVFENASWYSLKSGDFNNDGKPDLVVGTADGFLEVLLNRGVENNTPVVEFKRLPFNIYNNAINESGDMSLKPFPVDWNNDGKTDLLITGWQGFYFLCLNNGNVGEFSFSTPQLLNKKGGIMVHADSPSPCFVDWDNDGDLDIICGSAIGNIMYYENTAGPGQPPKYKGGRFLYNNIGNRITVNSVEAGGTVQGMEERYWGYLSVDAVDVDKDGDLDVVINDALGRVRWIENVGTRTTPVLSSNIHNFMFNNSPLITPWRNKPGVVDWDNDGLLNIIVLNKNHELVNYTQTAENSSNLVVKDYLRDRDGIAIVILRGTAPGNDGRFQIAVGDLDGDGDFDLVVGEPRTYTNGGNLTYLKNVGTNTFPAFEYDYLKIRGGKRFVEWTGSDGHDAWHSSHPSLVDLDGDGKLDLVMGTESGRMSYYSNNYFYGNKFPVFSASSFEERNPSGGVNRILDFTNLTPLTKSLNTQNIQIQILPEEMERETEVFQSKLEKSFTQGNLVVQRLGDGSQPITSAAQPVFLDEYTTAGELVQTIAIPNTGEKRLVISGNASQGYGSLSGDGKNISLIGYDVALGTSYENLRGPLIPKKISMISSGEINIYPIGLIDLIDTRAAVSSDGQNVWFGGQKEGVRFTQVGTTGSTSITTSLLGAVRSMNIYDGQLYVSTSNSTGFITKVGQGTPETQASTTPIVPTTSDLNYLAHGFVFFDTDPEIPGADLLYVSCDQGLGFLRKYSFDGTKWNEITPAASGQLYKNTSMTGAIVDGIPMLYATSATGSSVVRIIDNAAFKSSMNLSTILLFTAPSNTHFRGLTFSPGSLGTGVRLPISNTLNVTVINGIIYFNAEKGDIVTLYNLTGHQLVSLQATEGKNSLQAPSNGLLILKVADKHAKILIN